MDIEILDKRDEYSSACYLCKINLFEYLESLPPDYKDWDVQRGIVSNRYLDSLIDTVIERKHIPPLVLVAEHVNEQSNTVDDFRILDGLQRTYRLKTIKDSFDYITEQTRENPDFINITPIKLSRNHSKLINEKGGATNIVQKLIGIVKQGEIDFLNDCLLNNSQWMEVWVNLTPAEQVEKMLLLNAGHKAVNIKHQVELLFRTLFPLIQEATKRKIELVREKNISSISYSKNRQVGQFHFSHLVSSLVSLESGKPVTTNADFVQKVQKEQLSVDFSYETIESACKLLIDLDENLEVIYGPQAVRWLGREVVLTGIMGAIGDYAKENNIELSRAVEVAGKKISSKYDALNIGLFEDARNRLDLSKVNIGNINKKAVYEGVKALISNETQSINWEEYFSGVKNA
jgi:hypothetical protein